MSQILRVECIACNDIAWWCRGCGGSEKMKGLKNAGFTMEEVHSIYDAQFGCCSESVVPCYVCNKSGTQEFPENWAEIKDEHFWK